MYLEKQPTVPSWILSLTDDEKKWVSENEEDYSLLLEKIKNEKNRVPKIRLCVLKKYLVKHKFLQVSDNAHQNFVHWCEENDVPKAYILKARRWKELSERPEKNSNKEKVNKGSYYFTLFFLLASTLTLIFFEEVSRVGIIVAFIAFLTGESYLFMTREPNESPVKKMDRNATFNSLMGIAFLMIFTLSVFASLEKTVRLHNEAALLINFSNYLSQKDPVINEKRDNAVKEYNDFIDDKYFIKSILDYHKINYEFVVDK